jgi:hypothetical protein
MSRVRRVAPTLLAPLALACGPAIADYQSESSAPTGCIANEIDIGDQHSTWSGNTRRWTARCDGKTYRCTGDGTRVACTAAR